MIMTCGTQD